MSNNDLGKDTIKEIKTKRKETFKRRVTIFWYSIVYVLTGIAIMVTVGHSAYEAVTQHPRDGLTIFYLACAGWVAWPVLMYAGRGFLKEGIFKVLTDLARQELAKKEGK